MKKLSAFILKHKKAIVSVFAVFTIVSLLLMGKVKINYNLSDYLPKGTSSLNALNEMSKSYNSTIPNVKLMIKDVTLEEALSYKNKIKEVNGVIDILWADNYIDLRDKDNAKLNEWYKNNNALYLISINTKDSKKVINDIKNVIKKDSLMAGDAVNVASAQKNIQDEMTKILIFVVPIILIILLLTTSSWFEPVLFLTAIGISIIINMGSNIIFKDVSSITQSAAAILQLAVSMDYAIFLLHRFAMHRHNGNNVEESMKQSIEDSSVTIIASALTTIFGFVALTIMKFRIGPDLGIVLTKGVVLSLISVIFLLPVLSTLTYKLIDKTHHKSLLSSFNKITKGIIKCRYVIFALVLLIIVPSFIAGQNNNFLYGSSGINSESSQVYKDTNAINKEFGINNQMVLLIPVGDYQKELKLVTDIGRLNHVTSINSFVTTFGLNTPIQFIPNNILSQFISSKYSRIIINTNSKEEGKDTFKLVKEIKDISNKYYHKSYYLAGISVTNYDMKEVITKDNLLVNILAFISILMVLIVTFKSVLLPIVLIMTIEAAIWINLSIAYLSGDSLNYIGYLIISTVQLGATVDYAILLTKKYLNRKEDSNKERVISTLKETIPSILSSSFILAIAGFGLGFISSNGVISELGVLIGRGALISAVMVLLFIPSSFMIFNKLIKFKQK
jgi:predicted RND superfamily exporter protein